MRTLPPLMLGSLLLGGSLSLGCEQETAEGDPTRIPADNSGDTAPPVEGVSDAGAPSGEPDASASSGGPDAATGGGDGALADAAPDMASPAACAPGADDADCADAAVDETDPGPCGDGREVVDLNAALAAHGHYDGDTRGAPGGLVGLCGGAAGGEVVLKYTFDSTRALTFATDYPETTAATVLYVREECRESADLECNRGTNSAPGTRLRFEPPAPGTYYLVVDTGSRDGGGPFRLTAEEQPPPVCSDQRDNDADGLVDLADPGCEGPDDDDELDPPVVPLCADGIDNDDDGLTDYPADPDCEAAGSDAELGLSCRLDPDILVVPPGGGQVQYDTNGRANNYQGTCGGTGPEQVVGIRTNVRARLTFSILQASHDVLIFVRRDCDDAASAVGCNDDFNGLLSRVTVADAEPGTYYLFIDGWAGRTGQGTAEILVEPL